MRIGIDARFYSHIGKGLGRYTEKLIRELEALESEHQYFIFLRRENFDEYLPQNPRFQKVLAHFQWYSWEEQIFFPRLLMSYKLDVVHFPHFNVPLFYRKPFVVTIHDLILFHYPTVKASELSPMLYWIKYLVYRGVIHQAIHRARAVLTVSCFTQQDILHQMPMVRNKLVLTPEATDEFCYWMPAEETREFLRSQNLWIDDRQGSSGAPRPYVLYVGNAYPHKNLDQIMVCARAFPDYNFLCVGKGDYFYRMFWGRVESQKLTNVKLLGFVSDRELSVLYRSARLFFFPSLYEGFGLPALEALSHGLPVLATNRGALPEVLGNAGLFFEPGDVQTMIDLMRRLLVDETLRAKLRERGFSQITRYHWKSMAEATRVVYATSLKS